MQHTCMYVPDKPIRRCRSDSTLITPAGGCVVTDTIMVAGKNSRRMKARRVSKLKYFVVEKKKKR